MSKYESALVRLASLVEDIKYILDDINDQPETVAGCDLAYRDVERLGDLAARLSEQAPRVLDAILVRRIECAKTHGGWTVTVSHDDAPTRYLDFASYGEAVAWVQTLSEAKIIDGESATWFHGRVWLDPAE